MPASPKRFLADLRVMHPDKIPPIIIERAQTRVILAGKTRYRRHRGFAEMLSSQN